MAPMIAIRRRNANVAPEGATIQRLTDLGDPKSLAATTPLYPHDSTESRENHAPRRPPLDEEHS